MTGQVNSLRSRGEAAAAEISRLDRRPAPGRGPGRPGVAVVHGASRPRSPASTPVSSVWMASYEAAVEVLNEYRAAAGRAAIVRSKSPLHERAALAARVEAFVWGSIAKTQARSALARCNGSTRRAAGISRRRWSGFKPRTRPQLQRPSARQPTARGCHRIQAAMEAFDHLRAEDLGRAGLLLGGAVGDRADRRMAGRFLRRPGTRLSWSKYRDELDTPRCSACCARLPSSRTCQQPEA